MARVPLPDDVDPRDLDRDVRKQLMSLSKDTAEVVARHLVMAGRLMDEEPEQALTHARAARALAGRVGAVREANGLVAYVAGEWAEALSELRTARRLTGEPDHLAVMADCERALGHPDRALIVADDPQAKGLAPSTRVELLIVASGARRDMGQADAAVVSLQVAALEGPVRPWTARLRYAYADALLDAGRDDEARQWFARAADADELGETDADERLLTLDGVVFADLQGDDDAEEPEAVPTDALIELDMSTFRTANSPSAVAAPDPASTSPSGPLLGPDQPAPAVQAVPVDGAGADGPPDRSGTTGLGFVAPPGPDGDDPTGVA